MRPLISSLLDALRADPYCPQSWQQLAAAYDAADCEREAVRCREALERVEVAESLPGETEHQRRLRNFERNAARDGQRLLMLNLRVYEALRRS